MHVCMCEIPSFWPDLEGGMGVVSAPLKPFPGVPRNQHFRKM